MDTGIQTTINTGAETFGAAARAIIEQGVLGALLVLSIMANIALVVALIRSYKRAARFQQYGGTGNG